MIKLVKVFHEVRRVLRDDGTLWLNLGDSYASNSVRNNGNEGYNDGRANRTSRLGGSPVANLKPKDLIGIPWRVAFALQADGWWLRSDIIWAKPNPMPESVRDRPTKSHEYIFLLAKSGITQFWTHRDATLAERVYARPPPDYRWIHRTTCEEVSYDPGDLDNWRKVNLWSGHDYYYDQDAIKEFAHYPDDDRKPYAPGQVDKRGNGHDRSGGKHLGRDATYRNKRDVWWVATQPFPDAHYAVYPPELIRPCILAGCPLGGIVVDPFFGTGTTGLVAKQEGRHYLGIDLDPEWAEEKAQERIERECQMERLV